jgi:hypothetical protein
VKRIAVLALGFVLLATGGLAVQSEPYTNRQRLDHFRKSTLSARAAAKAGASAGFGEAINSPHEWGRGPSGFAKRFGSALATHAVKGGIELGVGALRHEDPRYYPSGRHGFWPRTKYALVSTVLVRRQGHAKRGVAVGRISGAMGAGLISRLWQPARLHTIGSGVATGGILLATDAGANEVREFWPEIKRKFHRNGKL